MAIEERDGLDGPLASDGGHYVSYAYGVLNSDVPDPDERAKLLNRYWDGLMAKMRIEYPGKVCEWRSRPVIADDGEGRTKISGRMRFV